MYHSDYDLDFIEYQQSQELDNWSDSDIESEVNSELAVWGSNESL